MTPTDVQIAELRATGSTLQDIATIQSVHVSTISRRARKEEVKNLIESLQTQFVAFAAAKATQNIIDIVHNESQEIEFVREKNKYSAEILRSIGLLPSHTQSAIVLNLSQTNNEIHLEGAAKQALAHLGVIDVVPEE